MSKVKSILYWEGRPVLELSYDELMAAFIELAAIASDSMEQVKSSRLQTAKILQLVASRRS